MNRFTQILNIHIHRITAKELLRQLDSGIMFTPNVDHLVKLQHDADLYNAYMQAEWVVCDSRILYGASKLLNRPIPEPIPGSSFFEAYCENHQKDPDCRIFLLGAKEGVAAEAMRRINMRAGRSLVVDAHSPSFIVERDETECEEIIKRINVSGATVLVVGLGCPKQEKWIAKYRRKMPSIRLFMALGATLDFEAGVLRRAPHSWQRFGLEWFYRFLKEPRRLFRRYFVEDMTFFWYFGKQLMGKYHNPWENETSEPFGK